MDNPGVYTLAALQIGAAMPQSLLTPITELDGMTAVTLEADFSYGSGGTTCIAIVATTFDGGTTWRHIARFDFATASLNKQCNLEGMLSKAVTVYADLAAEGVNDGVLGDQLALILTTTGAYVNTTLSVRASVR
jgi:hypothetical protein